MTKSLAESNPEQTIMKRVVEPAPDADFVLNTPITPHSTRTKLPTHSALKRQTKTPLSKKKLQFDLEPVDELDTTSEVRPEVSPDLPHICREKRKHEINTQNLPMKKRKIDFSTRNVQAEILSQHIP